MLYDFRIFFFWKLNTLFQLLFQTILIKHWHILADWHWHWQSADWHHLIVVWRESGSGRRRWKSGLALLDEDRIKIQLTGSTITFNTWVVSRFNYTAESSIMLSLLLLIGFEGNRKCVSRKKSISHSKLWAQPNCINSVIWNMTGWLTWRLEKEWPDFWGERTLQRFFKACSWSSLSGECDLENGRRFFEQPPFFVSARLHRITEWQAGTGGLK